MEQVHVVQRQQHVHNQHQVYSEHIRKREQVVVQQHEIDSIQRKQQQQILQHVQHDIIVRQER